MNSAFQLREHMRQAILEEIPHRKSRVLLDQVVKEPIKRMYRKINRFVQLLSFDLMDRIVRVLPGNLRNEIADEARKRAGYRYTNDNQSGGRLLTEQR
jgi:hypothetical protein